MELWTALNGSRPPFFRGIHKRPKIVLGSGRPGGLVEADKYFPGKCKMMGGQIFEKLHPILDIPPGASVSMDIKILRIDCDDVISTNLARQCLAEIDAASNSRNAEKIEQVGINLTIRKI